MIIENGECITDTKTVINRTVLTMVVIPPGTPLKSTVTSQCLMKQKGNFKLSVRAGVGKGHDDF